MEPTHPASDARPAGRLPRGTEAERWRQRFDLLVRTSQALAAATQSEAALLEVVAEACAVDLADGCLVRLVGPSHAVTYCDRDPALGQRVRGQLRDEPGDHRVEALTARVLATGEPLLLAHVEPADRRRLGLAGAHPMWDAVRPHSLIVAALAADGAALGLLWLARRDPALPAFDQDDLEVARALGLQAGIAMQNARLLHELRAGTAGPARAQAGDDEVRRQLGAVLDAIPAGVCIADPSGRLVENNAASVRIWGGKINARDIAAYGHYEGRWATTGEPLTAEDWALARTLRTSEPCSGQLVDIVRFDGQQATILNSAAPILDARGHLEGAVCVFVDVTDRQREAKALAASEARYRFPVDFLPMTVWTADPDGKLQFINEFGRAFLGVTGADAGELAGNAWVRAVHPDDRERLWDAWQRAVESGEPLAQEYRVRRHDGEYRWCSSRARPMRDAADRVVLWYGLTIDVDDLRLAVEQAHGAQRLAAVARLAGGVAHEINNMMAVVLGFAGMLSDSLDGDDARRRDVDQILAAADRAAETMEQLLAYSGGQIVQPVTLAPAQVVHGLEPALRSLLPPDVQLAVRAQATDAHVRIDRGQFEQVVVNLVTNAIEATSTGGRVTIDVDTAEFEADRLPRHPETTVRPGSYVRLAISDTGHGMDAATLARIWDPFFTTKPRGKATGMGLATTHGIVKHAGGYAWAYSEPGLGTSIKVYLPQVARAVAEAEPPPTQAAEGFGTVLVVDDEPMLRELGRRLLEEKGYRTLVAADGEEALRLVEQHCGGIDLVVTDLVMPGLTGRELGERLAVLHRDLPVLYMSGYTDDEVVRRGLLGAGKPFLGKPFSNADLLGRVRDLMARRRRG